MADEVVRIWNLDAPAQARQFLCGLHYEGVRMTHVILPNGSYLPFNAMNDAQAVEHAHRLYHQFGFDPKLKTKRKLVKQIHSKRKEDTENT